MNKSEFDKYIQKFGDNLETDFWSEINDNIKLLTSAAPACSINYCNERTVGYFAEQFISNLKPTIKVNNLFNEYSIITENQKIDNSYLVGIKKDVFIGKHNFIPDTFFELNNEFYFIEYKVIESSFRYSDFAHDLLKFVHYSQYFSNNQNFIYINFNKLNIKGIKYPTLKNGEASVKWDLISLPISSKSIKKDVRVYVLEKHHCLKLNDTAILLMNSLSKIKMHSFYFNDEDGDRLFLASGEYDDYVANKDSFGNNVITSSIIKNYYSNIIQIANYFHNNPISIKTSKREELYNSNELQLLRPDEYKQAGLHLKNFIKNYQKEESAKINTSRFNVSNKNSCWILALLAAFSELFKIDNLTSIKLFDSKLKKDFEEHKNFIIKKYRDGNKENINGMCFEISTFIENIYPKYFKIENNIVGDIKDIYIIKQNRKIIKKQLNKIKKIFGLKNDTNFTITNPEYFNFKILEKTLDLLK